MQHALYNALKPKVEVPPGKRGRGVHWKYFNPLVPNTIKVQNYMGKGSDLRRIFWTLLLFGSMVLVSLAAIIYHAYKG